MSTLLHLSTLIEVAASFWASFTGLFEAAVLLAALNYLAILIRKIYQFTQFVYRLGQTIGHVYFSYIKPQLDRIDWVHVRKTALIDSVRTIAAAVAIYEIAAEHTSISIEAAKAAHQWWIGRIEYQSIPASRPITVNLPIITAADLPAFTPSYA